MCPQPAKDRVAKSAKRSKRSGSNAPPSGQAARPRSQKRPPAREEKPRAPGARAGPSSGHDPPFAELKRVLARFASRLVVVQDEPDVYHLNSRAHGPNGKPLFFAAVRRGKSYVSYHLMPVYTHPELLDGLDIVLRRRMQGKSCFNFQNVEPALFRELGLLTERGFETWKLAGWI